MAHHGNTQPLASLLACCVTTCLPAVQLIDLLGGIKDLSVNPLKACIPMDLNTSSMLVVAPAGHYVNVHTVCLCTMLTPVEREMVAMFRLYGEWISAPWLSNFVLRKSVPLAALHHWYKSACNRQWSEIEALVTLVP